MRLWTVSGSVNLLLFSVYNLQTTQLPLALLTGLGLHFSICTGFLPGTPPTPMTPTEMVVVRMGWLEICPLSSKVGKAPQSMLGSL